MRGRYEVVVRNRRLQYKFAIERNITILRGDSATGKTTLIDMIAAYQRTGEQSGVEIRSEKPCVVLTSLNWEVNLEAIHDSIVFIDEGEKFVTSIEFARKAQESNNYYVIATRAALSSLPYSVKEIYGIKNTAGNRYQGTKRLYAEFYPLCDEVQKSYEIPDLVIVEDSNAGYEFFSYLLNQSGIRCLSAEGKSNIYHMLCEENYSMALVIADGAAFGPEIEKVIALRKAKEIALYLPESFEWILLKSDLMNGKENVKDILDSPAEFIESTEFFSWERFFTALLTEVSKGTYLAYNKRNLNPKYLQKHEMQMIVKILPDLFRKSQMI